jgi:hypothetical protein
VIGCPTLLGVVAEFNMATNELRVTGVTGFSGGWEKPEEF